MSPCAASARFLLVLIFGAELCSSAPAQSPSPRSGSSAEQGSSASVEPAWWRRWRELPEAREPLALQRRSDWMLETKGNLATAARDEAARTIVLENGIVRRAIRLAPGMATLSLRHLGSGEELVRAVEPEAELELDGALVKVGGLTGQRNRAFLSPEELSRLDLGESSLRLVDLRLGPIRAPFAWKRTRHARELPWPPPGLELVLELVGVEESTRDLRVLVHHELYDGLPVCGKWIEIENRSARPLELGRLTTEILAFVEPESAVDERSAAWLEPNFEVLSDYSFAGMDHRTANRVARLLPDPRYETQVHYPRETPCLLRCEPPLGPGVEIAPGGRFESFRTWIVVHDSTERERRGLALRRALRSLAPWCTENPLMMHVRSAERAAFRLAVDQCAAVGFEMLIYTFGSGLDAESEDPAYRARIREDVAYAHARGLQVGAYSLFSSRRIDEANDCVNPRTGKTGGGRFGNAPCFGSRWGEDYYRKLTSFLEETGLDLLEHDGPYPGDVCASSDHPGHRGLADSQWRQWERSRALYRWCRERGIYVNQPDFYFLCGGSKTGMGYRETNWSLPRAEQQLHARQNLFDGTWSKPQTAGWMFVPLTEYHGGGAAATLEPLREHLADYEAQLAIHLGSGAQACWRGPRLFDTPETEALVARWVRWYREHRRILESDLIHVRRADGRDLDYMVQVDPDPDARERAFALIHNPLQVEVERELRLPLHYSGLRGSAWVRERAGPPERIAVDERAEAWLRVRVPAGGRTWLSVSAAR